MTLRTQLIISLPVSSVATRMVNAGTAIHASIHRDQIAHFWRLHVHFFLFGPSANKCSPESLWISAILSESPHKFRTSSHNPFNLASISLYATYRETEIKGDENSIRMRKGIYLRSKWALRIDLGISKEFHTL
jgi:hypothetical protein